MKKKLCLVLLILSFVLCSCQNLPVDPTKTPTMNAEEIQAAAQGTAEQLTYQTQTQDAINNPSPTPTMTNTPQPPATATVAMPVMPPTATQAARPYYSMGEKSYHLYEVGAPNAGTSSFVPQAFLYIEVCYQNAGSGPWTDNFRCAVVNQNNSIIEPKEVYLGKTVGTDEWACFSFNNYHAEAALGPASASFVIYTDTGAQLVNSNNSAFWTIY